MDEKLIDLYKQLDNVLHLRDGWLGFITDLFRLIGSGLVAFLTYINDFAESLVDKFLTLNDFYASGPMKDFMDDARPMVWAIFGLAVLILGFQIMFNKVQKRNEVIMNIILTLSFIIVLPDMMVNLGEITNKGIQVIKPSTESLSTNMVKSNVLDMKYYGDKDFQFSQSKTGTTDVPPRPRMKNGDSDVGTDDFKYANQLSLKTIPYIDYTEQIDQKRAKEFSSETAQKLFTNKLLVDGNDFSITELSNNSVPMTNIGEESYYRWHVNWFSLILSLVVVTLALVISLIKIGRLIFDLAFHQVFGMFVAVTDLTGGQRTKKMLAEIINTFAVLFVMVLLLKLFILYSAWVTDLKSSLGTIGVLFLLIAGAWALIDAPDVVQRVLGIDAGLRSGYAAMMGTYAAAKTGGAAIKGATKAVKGVTQGAINAGGFGKGVLSGAFKQTPKEMANIPNNSNTSSQMNPNQDSSNSLSQASESQNMFVPIPSQQEQSKAHQGMNSPSNTGQNQKGRSNVVPPNQSQTIPNQPKNGGNQGTNINPSSSIQGNTGLINGTEGNSPQSQSIPSTSSPSGNSQAEIQGIPSTNINSGNQIQGFNPITQPTKQGSSPTVEHRGDNGLWNKPHMQEAKHYNTLGGKTFRQSKESLIQANNSGVRLGQNVRRSVVGTVNVAKKINRTLKGNTSIEDRSNNRREDERL